MNKLMKSLCGTLWIALMCPSCDRPRVMIRLSICKRAVWWNGLEMLFMYRRNLMKVTISYMYLRNVCSISCTLFRRWELLRIVRVSRSLTLKMLQV